MNKIKVLLVEDEDVLAMLIKETLEMMGFEMIVAANGIQGWSCYKNEKPDICIVDVMMPGRDGFSLVEDIRKVNTTVPVIFLTAMTQTEDVLKGLKLGADDYMKKPFSMQELILRVKSLLRRNHPMPDGQLPALPEAINIGGYIFNYQNLELIKGAKVTRLSQREAELMKLLIENKNQLLDRKKALLEIWGADNYFNARNMDVYISKLRRYLETDVRVQIVNIRGYGYKLIEKNP